MLNADPSTRQRKPGKCPRVARVEKGSRRYGGKPFLMNRSLARREPASQRQETLLDQQFDLLLGVEPLIDRIDGRG